MKDLIEELYASGQTNDRFTYIAELMETLPSLYKISEYSDSNDVTCPPPAFNTFVRKCKTKSVQPNNDLVIDDAYIVNNVSADVCEYTILGVVRKWLTEGGVIKAIPNDMVELKMDNHTYVVKYIREVTPPVLVHYIDELLLRRRTPKDTTLVADVPTVDAFVARINKLKELIGDSLSGILINNLLWRANVYMDTITNPGEGVVKLSHLECRTPMVTYTKQGIDQMALNIRNELLRVITNDFSVQVIINVEWTAIYGVKVDISTTAHR